MTKALNPTQGWLFDTKVIRQWMTRGQIRTARRRRLEQEAVREMVGVVDDDRPIASVEAETKFRQQFSHLYGRGKR
jgi:hypothetical protein